MRQQEVDSNEEQRKIIEEYLEKHREAVGGRINYYKDEDKQIRRVKEIEPMHNFAIDWIIPEFDDKVQKLIVDHNGTPFDGMKAITKRVYGIFDRIEGLGGITLSWF